MAVLFNARYCFCILVLCCTVKLVRLTGIDILTENMKRNELQSIPCVKEFLVKYFRSDHAMKGSLVIMNLTPKPNTFQSRIIQSLNEDPYHEFSVMVKSAIRKHLNASHVSEKAQNYFMFIASNEDVNQTLHQWRSLPTWNPLAQVVVLFTTTLDTETLFRQMELILKELLECSMLNVNIISHRIDTNFIQAMTWFPYENRNCANEILNIQLIDECEYNNDVVNSSIGSKSMSNFNSMDHFRLKRDKIPLTLHGCPLTISTGVWEPFTFYEPKHGFNKGIEVLMLKTITNVLDMRPVYYILNDTRENRRTDSLNRGYLNLIDGYVNSITYIQIILNYYDMFAWHL